MTNGVKTSEFYVSIITLVMGLVCIILGAWQGKPELGSIGMVLMTGSAAGYGISRGLAKQGADAAPASPAPADAKAAASVVAKT